MRQTTHTLTKGTYYLSGPMTGYPDENRPAFNQAATRLRLGGVDVINPAELDEQDDRDDGLSYEEKLARDLDVVIHEADGIILLAGWAKSKGAIIEVRVAISLAKPVYALRSDLASSFYAAPVLDVLTAADVEEAIERASYEKAVAESLDDEGKRTLYGTKFTGFQGSDNWTLRTPSVDDLDLATDFGPLGPQPTATIIDDLEPPESVLQEAQRLVHGARNKDYGHPLDNHSLTADLVNRVLGTELTPEDVCVFNILQKLSRSRQDDAHRDTWVDVAGYAENLWMVKEERLRREQAEAQEDAA